MKPLTVVMLTCLVIYFLIGCAPSSVSDIESEPTPTPEPAIITHELEVIVEPTDTAIVLLNPKPFGNQRYVHGRTVTIDVLPQPGWQVDEWLGPVFEVAGRTAKINMNVSHSVIVSLVQSSARRPIPTPISGRVTKPPLPTAQPLSPPTLTSAPTTGHSTGEPTSCLAKAKAAYSEGKAFDGQGEYEKAIEKMDEVIRLDPQCAAAYSSRGFARLHLGQNHQALQDYDEAIRLAPEAGDLYYSYYNRGGVYSDLGQHRRGIQDFNEAIRLFPGQGWLYDGRAAIYDRMGDERKANADRDMACQFDVDRAYCGPAKHPTPAVVLTAMPFPTPTPIPTSTPVPTLTVTKTADTFDGTCDADCSLREATVTAGQGATIRIPAGTYTLEILELTIYKDLTLIGAGPQQTIIQAASSPETANHGVFDIERKASYLSRA